jgi:hypothetical protein
MTRAAGARLGLWASIGIAIAAPLSGPLGYLIVAGSAVIADGDRVLGVFTTIDALATLHGLLERR